MYARGLYGEGFHGDLSGATTAALLALSLALAEASYRLVEEPMRRSLFFSHSPQRGLALMVALTVGGLAITLGWRSLATTHDQAYNPFRAPAFEDWFAGACVENKSDVEPSGCTEGPEDGTDVVLLGDSHVAQWAAPLQEIGRERGWRLHYFIKANCPPIDYLIYDVEAKRLYPECSQWRDQALAGIAEIEPSLVIMSALSGYYELTDAEWVSSVKPVVTRLAEDADAVIWIDDVPLPSRDIPMCLSNRAWQRERFGRPILGGVCDFTPRQIIQPTAAAESVAREFENVWVVNMDDAVCPGGLCRAVKDGIVTYLDDNHISPTYARALSPALARALRIADPVFTMQ